MQVLYASGGRMYKRSVAAPHRSQEACLGCSQKDVTQKDVTQKDLTTLQLVEPQVLENVQQCSPHPAKLHEGR